MKKRILIFSPEVKDQDEIAFFLERYLKTFPAYSSDVQIHKYSSFGEPPLEDYLGHWYEVFVVLDQKITPPQKRYPSFKNTKEYRGLVNSFELHVKLCEEKDIPYIVYKGEIKTNRTSEFTAGIFVLTDKINKRLETIV